MFFFLSFETQISLETLFHRTPYIYYACSNFILFLKNEFNMNRVETCMHNKCMGSYGNLTKKRAKKEKKISLLGVAPRTTHLQNHLLCHAWLCSSRARWPLAPTFCPVVTRKSQIFCTIHMLGTLDFTVS